MKLYLLSLLLNTLLQPLFAQDIPQVLKQLETSLGNKSLSVSGILKDEKYMYLHAGKKFRNLVKKYAPQGSITIITPSEPGKKIKVKCTVTNSKGQPFSGALVYFYQTSAKGWYSDTGAHILIVGGDLNHARLFGYVYTDKNGEIEIGTIQPAGYPRSDLPAHIHIAMWKNNEYVPGVPGELLFEEDERLTSERKARSLLDGFLISKNTGTVSAPVYQYNFKVKM